MNDVYTQKRAARFISPGMPCLCLCLCLASWPHAGIPYYCCIRRLLFGRGLVVACVLCVVAGLCDGVGNILCEVGWGAGAEEGRRR